jgi:acyl-coenzyme A thioesterase PaaI-like protein
MPELAFQDYYPDDTAHCYGCGRLNTVGLQLKSYWHKEGDESVARITPRSEHTAIPGFVYGGLIASIIDCHSTGTAAAAAYFAEGRPMDSDPPLRYVTASLQVDFLKPTPLGPELEVWARAVEIKGRKVVVESWVRVEGEITARGRTVCVQMPADMLPKLG